MIRLGFSPITEKVYAGKLNKDGSFKSDKQDVTNDFIGTVINRWNGYEETITAGEKKYKIRVEEIN